MAAASQQKTKFIHSFIVAYWNHMKFIIYPPLLNIIIIKISLKKKIFLLSVYARWWWSNGENIHFSFFLSVFLLLQNLCNLPLPPKGFSQSTAAQNYINTYGGGLSTKNKIHSFIHCGILKWYEIYYISPPPKYYYYYYYFSRKKKFSSLCLCPMMMI